MSWGYDHPMADRDRMNRFVDRPAKGNDAFYNAQLELFRHWLRITRAALEDSGVGPAVIDEVMNRVTYACPPPLGSTDREREAAEMKQMLMTMSPAMLPTQKRSPL
jgi:hypothetical protein